MSALAAAPALAPEPGRGPAAEGVDARLHRVLRKLAEDIPGLTNVVLSDPQGLPISTLVRGAGATAATAMGTLLRSAAKSVTTNLGLPAPEDVVIEAGSSTVLVRCLGRGVTLIAVLQQDANLGLAKLELDRHAGSFQELVRQLQGT